MCGRTVFTLSRSRVNRVSGANADHLPDYVDVPKYNQCPQTQMVVLFRDSVGNRRELRMMRWGLKPRFETTQHLNTINARVEGVRTSKLYSRLIDTQRCVVIVDGYYEWTQTTTPHQPYLIRYMDSVPELAVASATKAQISTVSTQSTGSILPEKTSPLFLAGLYDQQDEFTFTILTTESTGPASHVHDRMPMLLSPESLEEWLSGSSFDEVAGFLIKENKRMSDQLQCIRVSPLVNSISNKSIEVTYPEAEAKKRSFEKGLGRFFSKVESPEKKFKSGNYFLRFFLSRYSTDPLLDHLYAVFTDYISLNMIIPFDKKFTVGFPPSK
jgi:putative SOS response-associated peptidase YedK